MNTCTKSETLPSNEWALLKALHDIALYQGHYASDKNPTVRGLKKIAIDAIDAFHEPPTAPETECVDLSPGSTKTEVFNAGARFARKLHAVTDWLERNQPDVFTRGLWDVIHDCDYAPAQKASERRCIHDKLPTQACNACWEMGGRIYEPAQNGSEV
jgi:hypothetical protein